MSTYPKDTLKCPCGELIRGDDEDDLVEKVYKHIEAEHPDLVGHYTREQILFMAY
jgi:predicted small metal-binding protein